MTGKELDLLLGTCLLTGKIMMENNAEVYQVEDTMSRIALTLGNLRSVSHVTQTGLFIGLDHTSTIRMEQITNRSINLKKVIKVNDLSRKYVASELTLEELYCKLRAIDRGRSFSPVWLQIVNAAVISGIIMVLFDGEMTDLPVTLVIGGLEYAAYLYSLKFFRVKFLSEFLSSLLIDIATIYSIRFGLGSDQGLIVIGCVMPLVPRAQITSAIRDLLTGHYVSGVSRGTGTMMTAMMIGFAIAFIPQLFYQERNTSMETIFIQSSFSFLTAAAFAVIINVPRRSLIHCGLSDAFGWMIYWICVRIGGSTAFDLLLNSLRVTFVSDLFSKRLKTPMTIFNIPGMVPLVPGDLAHQAVRNLVAESYRETAHYAVQAIMITGAVTLDLVLSEVFNHSTRSFKIKCDTIMTKRKKRPLR